MDESSISAVVVGDQFHTSCKRACGKARRKKRVLADVVIRGTRA